jgi:hypothetical protein
MEGVDGRTQDRLADEPERRHALDPGGLLLAVGKQPLNDVLMIIQDTGLRPSEVLSHSD